MKIFDCYSYLREGYGIRRAEWLPGIHLIYTGDDLVLEDKDGFCTEWKPVYEDVVCDDWYSERRN